MSDFDDILLMCAGALLGGIAVGVGVAQPIMGFLLAFATVGIGFSGGNAMVVVAGCALGCVSAEKLWRTFR